MIVRLEILAGRTKLEREFDLPDHLRGKRLLNAIDRVVEKTMKRESIDWDRWTLLHID